MAADFDELANSLNEIRRARQQAETLRDQLLGEYQRIRDEEADMPAELRDDERRRQGRDAMRKAIAAANRAIASIDQALREIERVSEEPDPPGP